MTDSANELSALLPDGSPESVQISTGETVEIRLIGVGKMPKAIKAALPLMDAVKQYIERVAQPDGGASVLDQVEIIAHLLAENGDSLFDFSSVVLNRPRAWFDDLSLDDFIKIATAWKDLNYDFFTKKAMPLLGLAPAAPNAPTDGQTP